MEALKGDNKKRKTELTAIAEPDDDSSSMFSSSKHHRNSSDDSLRKLTTTTSKHHRSGHYEEDDDSSSYSDVSEVTETSSVLYRDEVEIIKKMSEKETSNVNKWRIAVGVAFIVTAIAVTVATYLLLKHSDHGKFEVAYNQFARTMTDSAISHQRDLRDAMRSTAHAITVYSETAQTEWPYFYMPRFEQLAKDLKTLSGAEVVGINNIVTNEQRQSYVEWATAHYQDWIKEGHLIAYGSLAKLNTNVSKYNQFISRKDKGKFVPDIDQPVYHVRTTLSPPPRAYGPVTNWNVNHSAAAALGVSLDLKDFTLGSVRPFKALPKDEHMGHHTKDDVDNPHTFTYYPIFGSALNETDSEIVATLTSAVAWDCSMLNLLPSNVRGMIGVITNSCNQTYTYSVDGKDANYLGEGDFHDARYDQYEVRANLSIHEHPDFETTPGHCMYYMHVYPSDKFRDLYSTNDPEVFAAVVASAFVLVAIIFGVYDYMVRARNSVLVHNAAQINGIVSTLFPAEIRDRLIEQNNAQKRESKNLKSFLSDEQGTHYDTSFDTKPLADLFLETTVIFADIVGFTAWSSQREPSQVFRLLETLFCAFDRIAKRRHVYKVETVGDCYVAVCGLPKPRANHAMTIVRFARALLNMMQTVTRKLEVVLGPDTGDLSLRIGIHSGPVTGGVLRGDRSRFQLFGDTMNTAARIESTSMSGRIQISEETAKHLMKSGKAAWIKKRDDRVSAKGLKDMETYWVKVGVESDAGSSFGSCSIDADDLTCLKQLGVNVQPSVSSTNNENLDRLIQWNVQMLLGMIKHIVARRNALATISDSLTMGYSINEIKKTEGDMPLDEVKEIISLPKFNSKAARRQKNPDDVVLSASLISQLQDYVTNIATSYRGNAFHNFEHASHVVLSVTKLMSRIVALKDDYHDEDEEMDSSAIGSKEGRSLKDSKSGKDSKSKDCNKSRESKKMIAASLHDHTYGITSDPLTQFACAFSALIHDVDHTGVPNPTLITEDPVLASRYKNRSVAEQNSFDISWDLLMKDKYDELRNTLCATRTELARFRQLVINAVMATDLGDLELKKLRNARWAKAFDNQNKDASNILLGNELDLTLGNKTANGNNPIFDGVNRKATIVIEHIIQASDVSHTMQHWHIYRKWNECLFRELYAAYKAGRISGDPSESWYKGEIGFFDFYIIPLAKKLKECGVFGKSSDEYLNYAVRNRDEWKDKGEAVVAEMIHNVEKVDMC